MVESEIDKQPYISISNACTTMKGLKLLLAMSVLATFASAGSLNEELKNLDESQYYYNKDLYNSAKENIKTSFYFKKALNGLRDRSQLDYKHLRPLIPHKSSNEYNFNADGQWNDFLGENKNKQYEGNLFSGEKASNDQDNDIQRFSDKLYVFGSPDRHLNNEKIHKSGYNINLNLRKNDWEQLVEEEVEDEKHKVGEKEIQNEIDEEEDGQGEKEKWESEKWRDDNKEKWDEDKEEERDKEEEWEEEYYEMDEEEEEEEGDEEDEEGEENEEELVENDEGDSKKGDWESKVYYDDVEGEWVEKEWMNNEEKGEDKEWEDKEWGSEEGGGIHNEKWEEKEWVEKEEEEYEMDQEEEEEEDDEEDEEDEENEELVENEEEGDSKKEYWESGEEWKVEEMEKGYWESEEYDDVEGKWMEKEWINDEDNEENEDKEWEDKEWDSEEEEGVSNEKWEEKQWVGKREIEFRKVEGGGKRKLLREISNKGKLAEDLEEEQDDKAEQWNENDEREWMDEEGDEEGNEEEEEEYGEKYETPYRSERILLEKSIKKVDGLNWLYMGSEHNNADSDVNDEYHEEDGSDKLNDVKFGLLDYLDKIKSKGERNNYDTDMYYTELESNEGDMDY